MSALHVFDLDGTLLRGTSASLELAEALGERPFLEQLERESREGILSNLEFHRRTNVLWRRLSADVVRSTFEAAPWIEGIAEVWADIAARGEHSAVISMSPQFFVELLTPLGASVHASGNSIDGPVEPALVLEAASKVAIAEAIAVRHGVGRRRIVAYGDSYTDVPLFHSGVRTVAVNASQEVESIAERRYRGDSLWDAYRLGRELLAPARVAPQRQGNR